MSFKKKLPTRREASHEQLAVVRLVSQIEKAQGEVREQLVEEFFDKLKDDRKFALRVLEPVDGSLDHLKIKNGDNWTTLDQIASYSDPEVVINLLDRAISDKSYRYLIAEEHELIGGIGLASFTLAIVNLREAEVDDRPYHQLAKDIGLYHTIS